MDSLLYEMLGKRSGKKDFDITCSVVFTPTERIMFSKRIALIYLLLKDIEQDIIRDVLKVSKATVSKFSLLCNQNDDLRKQYMGILKHEGLLNVLEEIWMLITSPGTIGIDWSAARRRKWEHERKKIEGL